MGLSILLYVNFNGIKQEDWDSAYQESILLLSKFPAPLITLAQETIKGQDRFVFTKNIQKDIGTKDEHWSICGDLISYRRAESFELYRNIEHYTVISNAISDKDVLFANENDMDFIDGYGLAVFENKTQGYPYHLAVLAVAILLESRFPENTLTNGDFDRNQVENVIKWMKLILSKPVKMPISLDNKRLLSRLDKLYEDKQQIIRRFQALCRDSEEEKLATLLSLRDIAIVKEYWSDQLNYYSSLNQIGASELIFSLLHATQDIKQIIELIHHTKKFQLQQLLDVLTKSFITISFEEREPLLFFIRSDEGLVTIEEAFMQTMGKMAGIPTYRDFYISSAELLDIFSSYENENRKAFKKIITKNERQCRKELDTIASLVEQMKKEAEPEPVKNPNAVTIDVKGAITLPSHQISPEEAYLVDEIFFQKEKYEDPEEIGRHFAKAFNTLLKNLEKQGNFPDDGDRNYYLTSIYRASFTMGFALRESAWTDIDEEQNLDVLKNILILSLINNREINFWRWRIYLLEHKNLWHYLIPV